MQKGEIDIYVKWLIFDLWGKSLYIIYHAITWENKSVSVLVKCKMSASLLVNFSVQHYGPDSCLNMFFYMYFFMGFCAFL